MITAQFGVVESIYTPTRIETENSIVPTFAYNYEVGTYRSRTYQIGVRIDPSLNDIQSFAVVLFYESSDDNRIEIAKVDDTEHEEGTIHFDRYYREGEAETKDFEVEVHSVFEAEDLLEENWRWYARCYEENHGRE